jgi:hypothetical protein
VPAKPGIKLSVLEDIRIGWKPTNFNERDIILRDDVLGEMLKPPGAKTGPSRELVIGLDFGTSSTKVVIGDKTMNIAYAVPFMDSIGISSYLMPSALIEAPGGHYTLTGSGIRHSDLKLTMLEALSDDLANSRVCAFLALVIRQARAWLFETKRDQFLQAEIMWTLAIGQPADQATSERHRQHFKNLARVAWHLAGRSGHVPVDSALDAWHKRDHLDLDDELEVRPMAELSAQIHGFVSSTHFDARMPNIYLLVDVGAGTVDASLFHVRKESGGTVSFHFFTHSVELLGAANLNRARINWWLTQLSELQRKAEIEGCHYLKSVLSAIQEFEVMKLPTEFLESYPNSFKSYVKGVEVNFEGGVIDPDQSFYLRVRDQVAGKVLYGAWKAKLLDQNDVQGMPFFLCGGGSRHPFYASLKTRLQKTDGCTWLSVKPKELALPKNIYASGVNHGDYDRLSVAYGLSQLHPGVFERVTEMKPSVSASCAPDWSIAAIDKSIC